MAADDIYALGVTLYELLAGKPPFYTGEITHQILNEPPEPLAGRRATFAPGAPPLRPAWEKTIAACLAKEPSARPPSAGAVADWLGINRASSAPFGSRPPLETRRVPVWRRNPRLTRFGALAGAAALSIGAVALGLKAGANKGGVPVDAQPMTISYLRLTLMPIPAGSFTWEARSPGMRSRSPGSC